MRGLLISFIFLCCIIFNTKAQSVTPFTLNIAGFTSTQAGYSLTVSTGETISITNFVSANGVSLNSGFLQNNPPIITGIEDINNPFSTNEIRIIPNPVNTITNIYTDLIGIGQIQYQIMDVSSKLLYRSQSLTNIGSMLNQINLSNFPTGQYYIEVIYKPISGKAKSGIFKIIKL